MSTNEKSLRIVEKGNIFNKIKNIFKSIFCKENNTGTFLVNENVTGDERNFFAKFSSQFSNSKTKLLEIQDKLEKLGINRKNVIELTKDLTDDEKKELFDLYKVQINSYEKNTEKCKDKILKIKEKASWKK